MEAWNDIHGCAQAREVIGEDYEGTFERIAASLHGGMLAFRSVYVYTDVRQYACIYVRACVHVACVAKSRHKDVFGSTHVFHHLKQKTTEQFNCVRFLMHESICVHT